MTAQRHKIKFVVGDRVVIINVGGYTGAKGEVIQVKGFINEKYIVRLDASGKNTTPIKSRFLAKDRRNN